MTCLLVGIATERSCTSRTVSGRHTEALPFSHQLLGAAFKGPPRIQGEASEFVGISFDRSTFPMALRGRLSTTTTRRGHL